MLNVSENFIGFLGIFLITILLLTIPWWLNHGIFSVLKRNQYLSKRQFRADFKILFYLALGWAFILIASSLLGGINPEISLLGLFLFPFIFAGILKVVQTKKKQRLNAEFTYSLSSLQGLLELGIPFPQALSTLAEFHSLQLSEVLSLVCQRFKKGQSISSSCERLEQKSLSSDVARCLKILEIGYQKGASLIPILQVLQPVLEQELHTQEKLQSLKNNLWAQAFFAGCVPWGLLLVTWLFQPEMIENFLSQSQSKWWAAAAVFWEGVGFWMIHKHLRF